MNIINNKTVVVSNFKEFKTILTENNTYTYIYLDNDITIEESFIIGDKSKIIIDGTYNTNTHTITNNLIDSTISTSINSTIIFKNIKITSSNKVGGAPVAGTFKVVNNRWDSSKKQLFIQPNVNIKTDITNPNEIVFDNHQKPISFVLIVYVIVFYPIPFSPKSILIN